MFMKSNGYTDNSGIESINVVDEVEWVLAYRASDVSNAYSRIMAGIGVANKRLLAVDAADRAARTRLLVLQHLFGA